MKEHNRKQLQLGLGKIEGASAEVEAMSTKLDDMKRVVERKQLFCDKTLVQLIQQKRECDAKRQKVELEAAQSEREEAESAVLREEAKHDLDGVLASMEAANAALSGVSKSALTELKSYTKPAAIVGTVMSAVLILLHQEDLSWDAAKKALSDGNLLTTLKEYDIDQMATRSVLHKVSKLGLTAPEVMDSVKVRSLCGWLLGHGVR